MAKKILDNEETENEKKEEDNKESKKDSKKRKKALSTDILKDDRFAELFENEVKPNSNGPLIKIPEFTWPVC